MRKATASGVLVASAAAVALGACSEAHSQDGGPAVSRNFAVGGFSAIEVAGSYDVQVKTGANPSVTAHGPQKLLDGLVVEVKGDKLLIHSENHHGFFNINWGGSNDAVHVAVTVPQLQAATIAGSGDINVDQVRGESFEGTVAGSGDLGIGALNVKEYKLSLAGSGDAKAGAGNAQAGKIDMAGSGNLDLGGVTTQQLDVSMAGSGDLKAHSPGAAQISLMGSGDAEITGGAKCQVTKVGSGDIRCG